MSKYPLGMVRLPEGVIKGDRGRVWWLVGSMRAGEVEYASIFCDCVFFLNSFASFSSQWGRPV